MPLDGIVKGRDVTFTFRGTEYGKIEDIELNLGKLGFKKYSFLDSNVERQFPTIAEASSVSVTVAYSSDYAGLADEIYNPPDDAGAWVISGVGSGTGWLESCPVSDIKNTEYAKMKITIQVDDVVTLV